MRHILFISVAIGLLTGAQAVMAQDGSDVEQLLDVSADMNSAAVKLTKLKTHKPTQEAQKSALAKLDKLIAQLEEQARGNGNGNARGSKPAERSSIRQGEGSMGELHAARQTGKQWGELPAKERERILQSLNDGFPSHYQKILERYFARLAEEKPFEPTTDEEAKPTESKDSK